MISETLVPEDNIHYNQRSEKKNILDIISQDTGDGGLSLGLGVYNGKGIDVILQLMTLLNPWK